MIGNASRARQPRDVVSHRSRSRYGAHRMRAEILTIGDELCRGEIVDTNSSHLAAVLWDLSITTRWMTSCNDDEADIAAALSQAVARADLVVCSGAVSYTHLRAHETPEHLVCRL